MQYYSRAAHQNWVLFEGIFSSLLYGGTKEFGVLQWIWKLLGKKATWLVSIYDFNFRLLVNELLVHLPPEIFHFQIKTN